MHPLISLRNLIFTLFVLFAAFCAPEQRPAGSIPFCSSRVGLWSDCKTRCLPQEQLYAQCSSKLGLLFSTRIGLTDVQQYGWTYDSTEQCGLPAARIWKLTRVNVSKAITGYLSTIDTSTPDCTRARLDDRETEPDRIYYTAEDITSKQAAYLDNMSTPITPVSPTQIVQTFNAPADGDIANAASVNVGFQALENSVEALRYLTYGGGLRRRLAATSNTVMTIQPLGAVIVKQLGVWTAVPHTVATTIDPLALAGGAFAATTRYYVYANLVAGVITWSVSTTAPDVGLRYKTGDEQYQFITTFCTNAASNLLTYTQDDNVYTYTVRSTPGGGATGNLILDAGISGAIVSIPLGISVPSAASSVKIQVLAVAGAANAWADCGFSGLGFAGSALMLQPLLVAPYGSGQFTMPNVAFNYVNDGPTTQTTVWVIGFTY